MRKAVIGSLAHWENPKDPGFTEKRQAITSATQPSGAGHARLACHSGLDSPS